MDLTLLDHCWNQCILDHELIAPKAERGVSGLTRRVIKTSQEITKRKQTIVTLREIAVAAEDLLTEDDYKAFDLAETLAQTLAERDFPEDGRRGPAFFICKGLIEYVCIRNPVSSGYFVDYPDQHEKSNCIDLALITIGNPALDAIVTSRPFNDRDISEIAGSCLEALESFIPESRALLNGSALATPN